MKKGSIMDYGYNQGSIPNQQEIKDFLSKNKEQLCKINDQHFETEFDYNN